jgi:hypothetical protein
LISTHAFILKGAGLVLDVPDHCPCGLRQFPRRETARCPNLLSFALRYRRFATRLRSFKLPLLSDRDHQWQQREPGRAQHHRAESLTVTNPREPPPDPQPVQKAEQPYAAFPIAEATPQTEDRHGADKNCQHQRWGIANRALAKDTVPKIAIAVLNLRRFISVRSFRSCQGHQRHQGLGKACILITAVNTLTATGWLGAGEPYSVRLWTISHIAATAFRGHCHIK